MFFDKFKMLKIKDFLTPNTVLLTGAGVSTDSGIPDYRGPRGVYTRNKDFKPITFQQFMSNEEQRLKYWARSYLGWPLIQSAKPNATHEQLQKYKRKYPNSKIITQNVDGLHSKAGVDDIIEMHGSLHRVKCMSCLKMYPRLDIQDELSILNPSWQSIQQNAKSLDIASSNPDGDVNVTLDYSKFQVPNCHLCNGILKPDVVFFGENIIPSVKSKSYEAVENGSSLIVMGSSLTVFSSFRLVKLIHAKVPILIINLGQTRADEFCDLKIEQECANVIDQII